MINLKLSKLDWIACIGALFVIRLPDRDSFYRFQVDSPLNLVGWVGSIDQICCSSDRDLKEKAGP